MKQFCILIICFVIIIGGGIGEIKYLESNKNYIRADIDYIENMLNNSNYEKAEEQIKLTFKNWENSKNIWNIFVIHDEIDDIDEAFIELKEYIRAENIDECRVAIEKLRNNIEHVVLRQEVKIDNIF